MRYSIIIPIYNSQNTIDSCLSSIYRQIHDDAEIILIDDASTEDLSHIPNHPQLRVLTNEKNLGPSASRNVGAKHAHGELLVFVDADVEIMPGCLDALLYPLENNPEVLGANGIFSLKTPTKGYTSAFVNTSIHYQHTKHGDKINTCFTSICTIRKSAFKEMGGWDDRRSSRYADDINTRWYLPNESIVLVLGAQVLHHKAVPLLGLLKHRFNIGFHFIRSLKDNQSAFKSKPTKATLHPRYPINTILGIGILGTFIFPPLLPPLLGLSFMNNAKFIHFTYQRRGKREAILAGPLSLIEGIAYGLGTLKGTQHVLR